MLFIKYFSKLLKRKNQQLNHQELIISNKLEIMLGYKVINIQYFMDAFTIKSTKSIKNFERLEFLGDSVLGLIISEYLFEKYNQQDEGFLTQLKSKIVNRQNLNEIGEFFELTKLIVNLNNQSLSTDINGNLLESLIGAVYLDIGYDLCKKLVLNRILKENDLLKLENKIISYKAFLIQTCQQQKIDLKLETGHDEMPNNTFQFQSKVIVEGNLIAKASELSKKKAEEKACRRSYYFLLKSGKIHFENQ